MSTEQLKLTTPRDYRVLDAQLDLSTFDTLQMCGKLRACIQGEEYRCSKAVGTQLILKPYRMAARCTTAILESAIIMESKHRPQTQLPIWQILHLNDQVTFLDVPFCIHNDSGPPSPNADDTES